jgi:hypothetical protein
MKFLGTILLASFLLLPRAFAPPHGHLHDAINALLRAKTTLAEEDIRTAQHSLENAVAYAKGQHRPVDWGILKRKDALDQVNQAAKAIEGKDRVKAGKLIDQALKLTNEAISETPKK